MSKRFTDSKKWKNEWFRKLPLEAKLTWVYLCDECEFYGIIKMDYGLASFQLGFDINCEKIKQWFGQKVYFLSSEKILIVQFFEFQYGESKDSWSAKQKAIEKLEVYGFSIENNTLSLDWSLECCDFDHSGATVLDSDPTRLIKGKGIVKGNNKEIVKQEQIEIDLGIVKTQIKKKLIESWADTFPKEYLEIELKKARSWLIANEHKSPKSNFGRFLNDWFNRGWDSYRKGLTSVKPKITLEEMQTILGES